MMSPTAPRFNYDGDATLAPIIIILQKTGHPDDKLVIRPATTGTDFTATFTQNTIGARTERTLTHSELFPYMERFLEALPYDQQRAEHVQIDVPGYTSVLLRSTQVYDYMDTFYAHVRSLHNSWPFEVVGTRIRTSTQTQPAVPSYTWHSFPAATQTEETEHTETATRPKRSVSPRVTRSMAQQRAAY